MNPHRRSYSSLVTPILAFLLAAIASFSPVILPDSIKPVLSSIFLVAVIAVPTIVYGFGIKFTDKGYKTCVQCSESGEVRSHKVLLLLVAAIAVLMFFREDVHWVMLIALLIGFIIFFLLGFRIYTTTHAFWNATRKFHVTGSPAKVLGIIILLEAGLLFGMVARLLVLRYQ